MKLFTLLIFILTSFVVKAQNLVPNGSFESIDPNPSYGCTTGNCCPAPDGFSRGKPQYWENIWVTNGSNDVAGDYYNPCAANYSYLANYPGSNQVGCQLPLNGQSYYGFVAANVNSFPLSNEFAMNKTIPLTAGQQYYVEFYVSNAAGNPSYQWYSNAYVKHIGAYFILDANGLPATIQDINRLVPQIPNTFPATNFYTNTGWQKISGYFTPPTSGNWTMVIGNFDPGMATFQTDQCNTTQQILNPTIQLKESISSCNPNYQPCSSSNLSNCNASIMSYYFVDAVTVIPFDQTPPSYGPFVAPASSILCDNASITYNLQNIPFGASATWAVSPTGLFSSATSGTGATAALTAGNGANGIANLEYTLSSACATTPISTNIIVGAGVSSISFSGLQVYQATATRYDVRTQSTYVPGATQYNWYIDNVFQETDYGNTNTGFDGPAGLCRRTHYLKVDAVLVCGGTMSYTQGYTVSASQCSTGGGGAAPIKLKSYPNPASTTLSVQITDSLSTSGNTLDLPYDLHIMDRYSRKVFSISSNDKELNIPVDNLPPGIYYLNLVYADAILQKQIVIK